ncbi:hypothetical protein AB4Y72_19345 [Arthrobacter sp. YAF34]|uniref:hypothetical protein n=1 Tax=Arthrobacter sp. YAF34 TaxID=3233083 RepID=UPI003F93A326
MTELNQESNAEPDPAAHPTDQKHGPETGTVDGLADAASAQSPAADIAWPPLPSRRGAGAQQEREPQDHDAQDHEPREARAPIQDPAVSAVLDRLAALEQAPVSEHGELYAGMHDALLETLNEDVASHAGPARRVHAAGYGAS